MPVSRRHILQQGPVIGAFLRTAYQVATQKAGSGIDTPTPVMQSQVGPRNAAMVRDYIRWTGGSTASYKGVVPHHLFPQWGFPLIARTLDGIPYDMKKVLNGGTRMEINAPIPLGEPITMAACLESIDDNGSRAVLRQKLVTSTPSAPSALVTYGYAIVPLGKRDKTKPKKDKPRVPDNAREIGRRRLKTNAGWEFALLTGDFNPVHWVRPYAQAAGFKNTILHGYGTMSIAIEALNRVVFAGDASLLRTFDVKFVRPLVLPADVGVYITPNDRDGEGQIFVGDHPGGPAYMIGAYSHG